MMENEIIVEIVEDLFVLVNEKYASRKTNNRVGIISGMTGKVVTKNFTKSRK
jgi:hypothetical protein